MEIKELIEFADYAKEQYNIHIPLGLIKEYIKESPHMQKDATQKHIPTDCYPKEFVKWISFGSHPFVPWFDVYKGWYFTDEVDISKTLDELFIYWKEQIK